MYFDSRQISTLHTYSEAKHVFNLRAFVIIED